MGILLENVFGPENCSVRLTHERKKRFWRSGVVRRRSSPTKLPNEYLPKQNIYLPHSSDSERLSQRNTKETLLTRSRILLPSLKLAMRRFEIASCLRMCVFACLRKFNLLTNVMSELHKIRRRPYGRRRIIFCCLTKMTFHSSVARWPIECEWPFVLQAKCGSDTMLTVWTISHSNFGTRSQRQSHAN